MQRRIGVFVAVLGLVPAALLAQEPVPVPPPGSTEPPGQTGPLDRPDAPTAGQVMAYIQQRLEEGGLTALEARQSVEFLNNLLQRNPNSVPIMLLLGDLLLESETEADYQQARNLYRQVLSVEPNNFRANLGMGKIWLATRSPRQAASFLETSERVSPRDKLAETKRLLAIAYSGMGKQTQAVVKAEEAVQVDPEDLDSLSVLIESRLQAGRVDTQQLDMALRDVERYVALAARAVGAQPGKREPLARLNAALQLQITALREYHQSLYERNLQGQPTDELRAGQETAAAAALVRIADAMQRLAALQEILTLHDALLLLEKALEYDPRNVQNLEAAAEAYARVQNREGAVATYQRVLELDPGNAEAQQALEQLGAPGVPEPPPADEGLPGR